MFKRNFFLLFCLLTASQVISTPLPSISLPNSTPIPVTENTCNLPAPSFFHVKEIGSNWVKLGWTVTTPNIQHRVTTYKAISNTLVSTIIVPAGQTTVVVSNLMPGENYYSLINAICPDGTNSSFEAGPLDHAVIVSELVVSGVTESNYSASCGVSSYGQYCEFPANGYAYVFKIRPIGSNTGKQFNVARTSGLNGRLRAYTTSNTGQAYQLLIDGNPPTPQGTPGDIFEIYFGGIGSNPIAKFTLSELPGGVGHLTWALNSSTGYEIVKLPTSGSNGLSSDPTAGGYVRERNADATTEYLLEATAAPNPFSETLEVFLPNSPAETVQLQLFNLSGQKVLDQQFAGAEGQYALSTAHLSPGFYMLRIEADGVVQTLKVVKSE